MNATIIDILTNAYNKSSVAGTVATSIVLYLCYVRYRRYKNINTIRTKYPDPDAILHDPEAAAYINNHFSGKEFPYLYRMSLELALFKTFSVPTISKILAGTGEFDNKNGMDKPLRRTEDTDLLLTELTGIYGRVQNQLHKNPNTPEKDIQAQKQRATVALERLNELHGKYPIKNDDYLYTLALFICEPIEWITRYEWRKPDPREINAAFKVWYDIGKGMKIEGIPETYEGIAKFKEEYAASHVKHHPANWKVGEPTVHVLLTEFPTALRHALYPLFMRLLPSMLGACDVEAFQLPYRENPVLTALLQTIFGIRATVTKYLFLPRTSFLTRNPFYPNEKGRYIPNFFKYNPSPYAEGYKIEEFGPLKFLPKADHPPVTGGGKCPMMH